MDSLCELFTLESVDSTQEEAKRLIKTGKIKNHGLIIADEQSAGKGSYGKSWASPKNAGLYFSCICKIDFEPNNNFGDDFSAESAKLVINCLEIKYPDCKFEHKPINDIYYQGKKLAGILIETIQEQQQIFVISGIGINLVKSPMLIKESLPGNPKAEPIALEEITGCASIDKIQFASQVQKTLKALYKEKRHELCFGYLGIGR